MELTLSLIKEVGDTKNRRKRLLLDQMGLGDFSSQHKGTVSINPVPGFNNLCIKTPSIYDAVISSLKNKNLYSGADRVCFVSLGKPRFVRPLYSFKYVLLHLLLQAFPGAGFWNAMKFIGNYKTESKHYIDQNNFNYLDFYIDFLSLYGCSSNCYFSDSVKFLIRLRELLGTETCLVYLSRKPYMFDSDTNFIRIYKDKNAELVVNNECVPAKKIEKSFPGDEQFLIDYKSKNLGNGLYSFNFSICIGNTYKMRSPSMIFASINSIEGNQFIQKIIKIDPQKQLIVHFEFAGVKFKQGTYLFFLNIANKDAVIRKIRLPIYLQTTLDPDMKSITPYV